MKIDHRVVMTFRQILLMNFGFFGIQYSFGLQQTAINPVFSMLNANPDQLPLLNGLRQYANFVRSSCLP